MLEIKSICKNFGEKRVLKDVSFTIPTAQVWSLLGINGAGKSTLLKIICQLLPADKGEVLFNGISVDPQNGNLGCMIESPSFLRDLTGRQNLKALSFLYQGISNKRIDEVMELTGMSDHANTLFKKYSTGMKQRLYFAYSILNHPQLIVLDEPFNGLDPIGIKHMKDTIRFLSKKGCTILISGHNISDLQEISDGAVIIDQGKVVSIYPEIQGMNMTDVFLQSVKSDGTAQ